MHGDDGKRASELLVQVDLGGSMDVTLRSRSTFLIGKMVELARGVSVSELHRKKVNVGVNVLIKSIW